MQTATTLFFLLFTIYDIITARGKEDIDSIHDAVDAYICAMNPTTTITASSNMTKTILAAILRITTFWLEQH